MLFAVALAGATCAFPDDSSPEVYVTIQTPALVLLDGDEMTIQARAWRLIGTPDTGNGDDEPLGNVEFMWTTNDGSVARVDNNGGGYATVLGIAPGLADISARAVAFEQASNAALPLRVSAFLEIDSMTPANVKWGDQLTLWGVGIQFAFITQLEGAGLIPDSLSYVESQGFSRMSFWVPQPARTSQLFVLGPGVFFNTPDSVVVDTIDLYEPNTTSPTLLDLDAPGPYPQIPVVKFFNPALAFEELPRDTTTGYDWYRFARSDTTRPLTVVVRPQGNTDSSGLFMVVADTIEWTGSFHTPPTDSAARFWFVTSEGYYYCARGGFSPNILPFDSMIVALKTVPRYVPGNTGIHVLNFYGQRFNYLMIAADTVVPGQKLVQDRFEENDVCTMADDPAKIIPVAPFAPFGDTLTIDVPHDLDWYRFRVNAPLASDSTTIRIAPRPFGGAGTFDRSDLDLYVLDTNFAFMGAVTGVGSFDNVRLLLASGDYYLAVVDYSGEPTRYSLCISVRFGCVPPFAPAPPASTSAVARGSKLRSAEGVKPAGHRFSVPAAEVRADGRSPFRRP